MNSHIRLRAFLRYVGLSMVSAVVTVLGLWLLSFWTSFGFVASAQTKIFIVLTFVLVNGVAGFLYSIWKAGRTRDQILRIAEVCESIKGGDFSKKLHITASGEIGVLAQKINELSGNIERRFTDIYAERTQLKMIFASMIEGIVTIDSDWRIMFCNAKAMRLLDIEPREYKKQKLNEIQGFEPMIEIAELAEQKRQLVEKELKFYTESGKKVVIEVHAVNFSGENTSGVIIVLNDISELRKLQKMRRDFVANVSHEIKTPLTAIKGYTETLLDGALQDEKNCQRFINKISTNADRLLVLVQDILSLAKLESKEDDVQMVPISWRPIIENVVAVHEDLVVKNKVTIEIEKPDYDFMVLGDEESMMQIFDNLLTNAIRYTPEGGVIKVILERNKEQRLGLLIVEDTGVGIPRKLHKRVFERFYLVDKARSSEVGGTGLGLSIVKHLVGALGGEVSVESELGAGSQFKVSLSLTT